jgi:hypothetical protein
LRSYFSIICSNKLGDTYSHIIFTSSILVFGDKYNLLISHLS